MKLKSLTKTILEFCFEFCCLRKETKVSIIVHAGMTMFTLSPERSVLCGILAMAFLAALARRLCCEKKTIIFQEREHEKSLY